MKYLTSLIVTLFLFATSAVAQSHEPRWDQHRSGAQTTHGYNYNACAPRDHTVYGHTGYSPRRVIRRYYHNDPY